MVFLWIDREREALPREPLQRHLDACPVCRDRANEVESVLLLIRTRCTRRAAPDGLAERIRLRLSSLQES